MSFFASVAGGQNEIYVSPQIEALLGFSQEEWINEPVLWWRQTHPEDRDRVSLAFAATCVTGQPFRDVFRVLTRNGESVWVHAEARLVRDEQGRPLFLQGVGFDVTEQRKVQETREQLIREQAARAEAEAARRRAQEQAEIQVELNAALREVAEERERRLAAERAARAEAEAARDAALRLAAIVESSDDAVIGKTLEGIVTSWNPGAERLYGYTAEEMVGQSIGRIFPPDRPDELSNILARLSRGERIEHFETVRRRKDGSLVDVSVTVSPVRDAGDRVVGASAIARDVTERRRVEAERERLLASERAARAEAETLHRVGQALSAELELEHLVQAVTDAATELTGAQFGAFFYNVVDGAGERYRLYSLSGTPREAFADFPLPRNTSLFRATFRGEGVVRLADVRLDPRFGQNPPYRGPPPGHLPVVSYLAVPVVSRSGEVLGGLFFGHERPGVFTARAEHLAVGIAAQAAIALDNARLYRQAQDAVRTRDEFLSSAAHDLKTPLAAMKGFAQLLQRQASRPGGLSPGRLEEGLAQIDTAASKMTWLVDELLDIARLQIGQPLELTRRRIDLVALARRVIAAYQLTTRHHRLEFRSTTTALVGTWDGSRLERVLDNLLGNAVKYSPDGGDVVVELRQEGEAAVLVVRDHGVGIPPQDLPYIFNRFHRASNVAGRFKGSGIGLASVQQIVTHHGGTVEAESEEGRGSTFTVRLPLTYEDAPEAGEAVDG